MIDAYFEVQPQRMPSLPASGGRLNLFAKKVRRVSPKIIEFHLDIFE